MTGWKGVVDMDERLEAARAARESIAARPEVVFECRRGVHGNVTVYVEPDCKDQPQAWCCGVSMKKVRT
jgi:hypothetical protein